MTNTKILMLSVSSFAIAIMPSLTLAQDNSKSIEEIEEVVVTGSRRAARSSADTPSPVDIITASDFTNQSGSDMTNLLRNIVPSFNVNTQPLSDAATLIRPINLRGFASDQTLVLVNGKRRHRAAVIVVYGNNGLNEGAQGSDISSIPSMALKQVEILRDGAAAQYGSDAIAGVINFKLKDASDGGSLSAKYGKTYSGDGDLVQFGGNIGFPVTDNGFVNLTVEYSNSEPTSRSIQRSDAISLIADGNTDIANPAQIWGEPKISNNVKAAINFAVQASESAEIYAFGNFASRDVLGGFYYRNPDTRDSVYHAGNGNRLVGDLDVNDGFDCPGFNSAAPLAVGDKAGLASVIANEGCFVFNSILPGGYTPNFGGNVKDVAGVMGVRGELDNGLIYDLSISAASNEASYTIDNTVNPSLGPNTPSDLHFYLGSNKQTEKNFNADFSYPVSIRGFASDLNIASGFEFRQETFATNLGDQPSWEAGPLKDQGFGIGAHGFAGFGPSVVGEWSRKNIAFYLDLEADVTDDLILATAVRFEDFNDFGSTTNFKGSGLYKFSNSLRFRGSVSTGFRAPTPGQSNFNKVSTLYIDGSLQQVGTIASTNPIAVSKGGKQLTPEKSTSFTGGVIMDLGEGTLTLDYFHINLKDRIAISAQHSLSPSEAQALEATGVTGATDLSQFTFFTNDFSTRTQGIDVVFSYPINLGSGSTTFNTAFNWTDNKVTFASENIDSIRIDQLENILPGYRGNVSLVHNANSWRGVFRVNYISSTFDLTSGIERYNVGSEIFLDAELGFMIGNNVEFVVGAENLLNNFPTENPWGDYIGAKYSESSPMGAMGGFYYAKMKLIF